MPDGKMPYEMLYRKKPSLQKLQNWGTKVWVHTMDGSKLDGHLRVGCWIGLDEVSNGHQIYWPDRQSVSIERSVKFMNDDFVLLIARLIPGG